MCHITYLLTQTIDQTCRVEVEEEETTTEEEDTDLHDSSDTDSCGSKARGRRGSKCVLLFAPARSIRPTLLQRRSWHTAPGSPCSGCACFDLIHPGHNSMSCESYLNSTAELQARLGLSDTATLIVTSL